MDDIGKKKFPWAMSVGLDMLGSRIPRITFSKMT